MSGGKKITERGLPRAIRLEFKRAEIERDLSGGKGTRGMLGEKTGGVPDSFSMKPISGISTGTINSTGIKLDIKQSAPEIKFNLFNWIESALNSLGAAYFQIVFGLNTFVDGSSRTEPGFTPSERNQIERGFADLGRALTPIDYARADLQGPEGLMAVIETGDLPKIAGLAYAAFLRVIIKVVKPTNGVSILGDKGKVYLSIIGEEAFSEAAAIKRGLDNAEIIKNFLTNKYPAFSNYFEKLSAILGAINESVYSFVRDVVSGDPEKTTAILRLLMDGKIGDYRDALSPKTQSRGVRKIEPRTYEAVATPSDPQKQHLLISQRLVYKEIATTHLSLAIQRKLNSREEQWLNASVKVAPPIFIELIAECIRHQVYNFAMALAISLKIWPEALNEETEEYYLAELGYEHKEFKGILTSVNIEKLTSAIYRRYLSERVTILGGPQRVTKDQIRRYVENIESPLVFLVLSELFSDRKPTAFPQKIANLIRDPKRSSFLVIDFIDNYVSTAFSPE